MRSFRFLQKAMETMGETLSKMKLLTDKFFKLPASDKLAAFGLVFTLGSPIGWNILYTNWWREAKVRRHITSKKPGVKTDIPLYPRNDFNKDFGILYSQTCNPILIEGYQGTGKTVAIRQYLHENKKIPSVYISLKDVNDIVNPTPLLTRQFNYIGKGSAFDDVKGGLVCLHDAMLKVRKKTKNKPIFCVDDIQKVLPYGKSQAECSLGRYLVSTLGIKFADNGILPVYLSSDNSVMSTISGLSGIRERLIWWQFKEVPEGDFIKHMQKHKGNFNKKLDEESDQKRFFEVFGSNFRILSIFSDSKDQPLEGISYYYLTRFYKESDTCFNKQNKSFY